MYGFRGMRWVPPAALMIALSQSAPAEPIGNPDKFNQSRICTGKRVDVEKYFIELLDTFEITHSCLNAAAARLNIARDQRWPVPAAAGLLVNDIAKDTPACKNLRESIFDAQIVTAALLSRPSNEFFSVRWNVDTTGWEARRYIREFAAPGASKVQIDCLKLDQKDDKQDSSLKLSELKVGGWQVKLRQDQTSLEYARKGGTEKDKEGYKKAKSAKIAFSDDGLKDQSRYEIAATIGLDYGEQIECGGPSLSCRVIPYVKFERSATMPKAAKNDMDKITYGALGKLVWRPSDWLTSIVTLDTQYIVDSSGSQDAELFAETIRFKPALAFNGQSFPGGQIPLGPVYFNYEYGGILRYGTTIEAGDNAIFAQQKDFMYYGPEVNMWFYGAEGTFLQGFTLLLHYNILYRERGLFGQLPYFTADLSYKLDKDGDFDITLSYENGREFETFQERDQLKLSFGYKF
jgi:hypothetical protein